MEEKSIREYAQLMKELGLTGLEVTENGSTVRLERTIMAVQAPVTHGERPIQTEQEKEKEKGEDIKVCSPMVGVFYNAPTENAAPFVKEGDLVRRGDVLCIIEAMKLMNEIVADQDGIVTRVCTENKQVVDFGHVLFCLRKEQ